MGQFRTGKDTYYELQVGESGNALLALKGMLPFLDKKWSQVNAAIDYMENRITGNQFIKVLNEAVRARRRSSSIRTLNLPYTKEQALQFARTSARLGIGRVLTEDQLRMAQRDRELLGLTYAKLGEKYGVSESTMYYSLKRYT